MMTYRDVKTTKTKYNYLNYFLLCFKKVHKSFLVAGIREKWLILLIQKINNIY